MSEVENAGSGKSEVTSSGAGAINRRSLLKTAGALAASTGVLGAPAVLAQKTKKIRFLNIETAEGSKEVLLKGAAEYKKLTGVEVEIDTNSLDQAWIKVQASIRAGKPYELFMASFIGHVALLASQGSIVPLTSLTNKYKWGRDVLLPIKGEVYWYPYDYNHATVHYRKDFYEQNGFKPARTFDEYLKINKAFADGKSKVGSVFPIESGASTNWASTGFFWAEGVRLFDDKWNVIIDNAEMRPKVMRVLDFYAELAQYMPKDLAQASWLEGHNAFLAGNAAHYSFVPIAMELATMGKNNFKGKIGLTNYPSSTGKEVGMTAGYDGIVVTKGPNTAEAMRFLEWYVDNTYIDFICNRPLLYQPPRLDIYDNPKYINSPIVKDNPEAVQFLKDLVTKNDVVMGSIDTEGPEISEKAGKVFQSFAIPIMLQERLLKKTPSSQCVDIGAKIMRTALSK